MKREPRPLVLHVIHHLVIGGMENGLVNLINHLPEDRYSHAVACVEGYSDFRGRITRPDVEVFALHRSRIGIWALRRELYRLCRRLRPAIVHTRGLSGLDALLPAWCAGVPSRIHGEHGWDIDDLHGTRSRSTLLRRLHQPLVDRYVTVSKHLERFLVERVGIPAQRVRQIYNGVDTGRFAPHEHRSLDLLPEGFRAEGLVVIGSVGRLQRVKDQATLLRALALLRQRQPGLAERTRLLMVGDGPLHAELLQLADSLGLRGQCHFAGALHDVPRALSALDIFVLPSLAEGISNTILEAMASGLPIVATSVGGNVELVEEDGNGRLFQPGDVDRLADLLAAYIAAPALRRAHGHAARRMAQDRFSLDAMVGQYAALYDNQRDRRSFAVAAPAIAVGDAVPGPRGGQEI